MTDLTAEAVAALRALVREVERVAILKRSITPTSEGSARVIYTSTAYHVARSVLDKADLIGTTGR